MGLECKQVTLTSTLEFSLFSQGCPLKQSAGYKLANQKGLKNSLQFYLTGPIDKRKNDEEYEWPHGAREGTFLKREISLCR